MSWWWTWIWVSFVSWLMDSWWWIGMLQSTELQRVRHDCETELNSLETISLLLTPVKQGHNPGLILSYTQNWHYKAICFLVICVNVNLSSIISKWFRKFLCVVFASLLIIHRRKLEDLPYPLHIFSTICYPLPRKCLIMAYIVES